jgi:serine/threonine protein phosphatase PrpC
VRIAGTTHPGKVRQRNEDAIGWDERLGAAVLADGMGGLRDGDLASREAVEGVLAELAARGAAGETLCDATLTGVVQSANRRVWNLHGGRRGEAMGTTLVAAAAVSDSRCLIAHVGDSRAYRLRRGQLERLTADHSLVQQLVEQGVLSAEEVRWAPNRNVITRALGLEPDVTVTCREIAVEQEDLLLLCSDGLWEMLPDADIADGLAAVAGDAAELAAGAEMLVAAANAAGGVDNVSVVIMRF